MGYYLKLLSRTDPHGEVAARLAKYLITNRKHASYWNSTRDTAICVEALADYLSYVVLAPLIGAEAAAEVVTANA